MADIKTKDNAKGTIRTIDKAAVATQRMKQAYIATKEKAERSVNANSSSAEEYASDKLESGIDEVVHDGAYAFDKVGRKGFETTKENIRTAKDGIQRFKQQRANSLYENRLRITQALPLRLSIRRKRPLSSRLLPPERKPLSLPGKKQPKPHRNQLRRLNRLQRQR